MHRTTICVINQKGGCGKSTTCFHLAGHFAQTGRRVLLVDADPQGSLSQGFFGSEFVESLAPQSTIAELFAPGHGPATESVIAHTAFAGLHVLCANQSLARFNHPEPASSGLGQFTLEAFLKRQPQFELVIIDCPPNLYLCSWSAMLAADYVLIPVPPEDFGTQGLRAVHLAIENARMHNSNLRLLGHLITRADRRLLVHATYEQHLRNLYQESVLSVVVPEASAFKVSLACRTPVGFYAPKSKATLAIAQLGHEILARTALYESHRVTA